MSENIHNDDELYRKAYDNFEEEPSTDVWEKLNARLDQKDATLYRAKFIWWKRIAVVLIFLLGTAVAYELIFKPGNSSSTPTAEQEKLTPATDSTLQQPPPNQIQRPNDITDSINKEEVSIAPAGRQNNKQEAAHSDKNMVAEVLPSQTQEQHRTTGNDTSADETTTTKKITHLQDQQSAATVHDASKAEPGSNGESLNHPLLKEQIIADQKFKGGNESALLNANNGKSTDSITTNQHNDSALSIHQQLDSTGNNIAAVNKKSPIKIKKLFRPHFSFSPYIAADFTGHKIDNDEHHRDPDRRDEQHEIKERENEQFAFSASVLARYQFSQRFFLKSGLVYSNTAIHVKPEKLYATPDNSQGTSYKYISSLGYAYVKPSFDQSPVIGDSIYCEHVEQHASYLGIPLMAGYTINAGKKLTIAPGIGFTTNLLLSSKAHTELHKDNEQSKVTIKNMLGLAPVYFSFAADVELHYKLSNNFNLMLLPSFKHAIVPTTSNHVVKTYPYNFGLGLGLTYRL